MSPDTGTSPVGQSLRHAVAAAREEMFAGRERIGELHERGLDALQVCGRLTSLLDGIVTRLFDAAASELEPAEGDALRADLALVGLGSYGRRQLAPYSGSMGYGVPAAVAAKFVHPERAVVSWNGDGCFLMNGQELATAVQYGLRIVFVVIDNGMYGTIRMHQEREYPARVSGTNLVNPDFAALARAYGAHGETVATTDQFAPAFERALAADRASLLHVKVDPQALTMGASLDALRRQGQASAGATAAR